MHRRFRLEEVIIAAFLAPLSNLQMSIGTLLQVAGNIRGNMGIYMPKFIDAMSHEIRDVLLIHWSDLDEDGGIITCTVESAPTLRSLMRLPSKSHFARPLRGFDALDDLFLPE